MFSSVTLPPTKAIVDFVLFRVSASRCSPQSGPLTVVYKLGYNSTYRGYNPNYPFTKPFIRVVSPHS